MESASSTTQAMGISPVKFIMKITNPSRRPLILVLLLLLGVGNSCSYRATSSGTNSSQPTSQPQPASKQPQAASPLPAPTGFVNDFAKVFDAESKARLESALTELRDKAQIEFAVVTVETTGGQPIFDYSLAVARGWGIGPKDTSKGGGLLLMLAVKDRSWWLQVSRNLEKDLPNEVCKELGDRSKDLYRQGNYDEGLIRNVKAVIERLEGLKGFKLSSKL